MVITALNDQDHELAKIEFEFFGKLYAGTVPEASNRSTTRESLVDAFYRCQETIKPWLPGREEMKAKSFQDEKEAYRQAWGHFGEPGTAEFEENMARAMAEYNEKAKQKGEEAAEAAAALSAWEETLRTMNFAGGARAKRGK